MNWTHLTSTDQIEALISKSSEVPQLIFKHSTRCSISSVAYTRLEKGSAPANVDFYLVDVIQNRSISNLLAERFGVAHESPQVLLIRSGECIYDESHMGITMHDIVDQVSFA